MKLLSSRYLTSSCTVIICILVIIIYILVINYYKKLPIDIEPSLLYLVAEPGTYTGLSTFGKTEIYTDGLRNEHKLSIVKIANGIEAINTITSHNMKTEKIEVKLVRKISIIYHPHHGKQLFKIVTDNINDTIVSSVYGYATGKTENSIKFHLSGSWHISEVDYHTMENVMIRTNPNQINNVYTHPGLFGFNHFTMDEQYTMDR